MSKPRRERRRAVRVSDAADYDRTADAPHTHFGIENAADEQRHVILDPEVGDEGEELTGEEFWREQRPPHHGSGE